MSLRRLSDLPAELICLILQEFNSTLDFYSFIRASPQIYAAFLIQKQPILFNLLQRAVSAEVLRLDAQITLRSSQFPISTYGQMFGRSTEPNTFLSFIRNFEKTDCTNNQVSLDLLVPLCKLQSGIEYLIEDYCIHLCMHWNRLGCHQNRDAISTDSTMDRWGRLSETELVRLQRAFYRYGTCQNMMRASRLNSEHVYDQFADFLSAFSPWEVEEIACVHDYMLRRLDQVTQQLEEEFIQSVVDADKTIRQNEDLAEEASASAQARLKCLSKILHPEENSEDYHCLGWSQSLFGEGRLEDFFSIEAKESKYQQAQTKALATLGASFMRSFLESNSKSKLELISSYGGTWSYSLEDALENSFPSGQLFSIQHDSDLWNRLTASQGESASQPNKAWLWAKENNPNGDFYRRCDRDLMAWGYVFWDGERLRKMRAIEGLRPELRWSATPPGPLPPDQHANPSAEEKLMDMGLVWSCPDI